jgi:hypothetical protein
MNVSEIAVILGSLIVFGLFRTKIMQLKKDSPDNVPAGTAIALICIWIFMLLVLGIIDVL